MAADKISPEEKLLGLIKGNKISGEEKPGNEKLNSVKLKTPLDSKARKTFSLLRNRHLTCHIRRIFFDAAEHTRLWPKPLLIFIIILLFCFIGHEFHFSPSISHRIDLFGQEKRIEKSGVGEKSVTIKPYSYYAQEMQGKSLFSLLVIEKPAAAFTSTEKIEDLCKPYQLKGVILGERPEAFIEDTQTRRTITATIGDNIGKVQVIDIKEGRVTLGYEDQTYDLCF